MTLRLHGLSLGLDDREEESLARVVRARLGEHATRLRSVAIVRRSIDARHGGVRRIYSVDIEVEGEEDLGLPGIAPAPPPVALEVEVGRAPLAAPPLIVGAGPAGLFAGLLLAEHGYRPTIVDRGGTVAERTAALRSFHHTRQPDPECNALFGLGGAGTFSDGKLNSSVSHPWVRAVLATLVECGAPPEILIDSRPHVGTDRLHGVVPRLVERIERAGGVVRTGVRVDGFAVRDGAVEGASTTDGAVAAEVIVVATGHSARDTWEALAAAGVALEPKPFQLGVRVEHPQRWLDRTQYGRAAGHPALGSAEYKLTARIEGVPVFSFCMCPGGETMPTVHEAGHLALNGMSRWARDGATASSGLVVTLPPEVYGGRDLASCLAFVRGVEARCFEAGGGDYRAPAQRLTDFTAGRDPGGSLPATSYSLGVTAARLDQLLPRAVAEPLRAALRRFAGTLPGYLRAPAVALAPESRASSPIRIPRDRDTRQSVRVGGLYPVGEGAGHAGGILSCALDGLASARRIIETHARPA